MFGTIRRRRTRDTCLAAALLLLGLTAPLSLTRGNRVIGGNVSLAVLWSATVLFFLIAWLTSDGLFARLVGLREYMPSLSLSVVPPGKRVQREGRDAGAKDPALRRNRARTTAPPARIEIPTPSEALEMWMDNEGLDAARRSALRDQTAVYRGQLAEAVDAPEGLRRREAAQRLHEEGEVLEGVLWEERRKLARSQPMSFGSGLPKEFLAEVKAWNKRVLALADEHLPVKDAGAVAVYPALIAALVGSPSVEQLEALFRDNLTVLARIQAR